MTKKKKPRKKNQLSGDRDREDLFGGRSNGFLREDPSLGYARWKRVGLGEKTIGRKHVGGGKHTGGGSSDSCQTMSVLR